MRNPTQYTLPRIVPRIALLAWLAFALCLTVKPAGAVSVPSLPDTTDNKVYIGLGAGFESGNGVRLGFSRGHHGAETTIGVMYLGETGTLQYSYGLRYLYTLYDGAYAWTGAARTGHRDGLDRASLTSGGAGIGVIWKMGSMFRFMLDSGWRVYSDTDVGDGGLQINPTINTAVVYMW